MATIHKKTDPRANTPRRSRRLVGAATFAVGLVVLGAARLPAQTPTPTPTPTTTPTTSVEAPDQPGSDLAKANVVESQFDVWVESGKLSERGDLIEFAKSVNDDFDRLFALDGSWRVKIRVKLYGELGKGGGRQWAQTEIEQVGNGFRILLRLRLPEGFDNRWLEREFVRLLVLEQMLSGQAAAALFASLPPDAGADSAINRKVAARVEVPYWLTMGVSEVIEHRSKGRPSELYSRLVRSRQVLPIEQLLGTSEEGVGEDSLSKSIFRASAGALVEALLNQGDEQEDLANVGARNFCHWLAALPGHEGDPGPLFREHFPSLRTGEASLAKWWTLQVASMGQMQALEYYSVDKSEGVIADALLIRMPETSVAAGLAENPDEEGAIKRVLGWFSGDDEESFVAGRLHDFKQFVEHPQASVVLEVCRQRLEGAKARCFPLYRPVVEKYAAVVERLLQGDTGGVVKLLDEADLERAQVRGVMTRVGDFMNYHEATRVSTRSGDFEAYERTLRELREQKPPTRDDRISKHLDGLQEEFR